VVLSAVASGREESEESPKDRDPRQNGNHRARSRADIADTPQDGEQDDSSKLSEVVGPPR
jgi:hypothetical protein